jgi:hypothetical protein
MRGANIGRSNEDEEVNPREEAFGVTAPTSSYSTILIRPPTPPFETVTVRDICRLGLRID